MAERYCTMLRIVRDKVLRTDAVGGDRIFYVGSVNLVLYN